MNLTATHLSYYATCKRKLWLFSHQITCEHESELVRIGKIHHEEMEKNSIEIDNIRIDMMKDGKVFELKKKNTAPEAARLQVLFYLWKLKQKEVITSGMIKYKENNRIEDVELTPETEKHLLDAMENTEDIMGAKKPPEAERIKYCRKCSYNELCFS